MHTSPACVLADDACCSVPCAFLQCFYAHLMIIFCKLHVHAFCCIPSPASTAHNAQTALLTSTHAGVPMRHMA